MFAYYQLWALAVVSIVVLLFTTYVSSSHDLVHRNLGINKTLNGFLLTLMEMLVLRSGHTFKIAHLNHHKYFPNHEDIEGRTARMSLLRTLLEGPVYQFRLYAWAWKKATAKDKPWLLVEGLWFISLVGLSIFLFPLSPLLFIYVCLVLVGSWIYPLFTVYIPHNAKETDPLFQTKAFRGPVLSTLFAHHNYHLEHHLYPMVPHQNWHKLSKRLDPYFNKLGVKIIKI
ncbi:MAG: fatty acid desaturase [Bacteroidota bacterium]